MSATTTLAILKSPLLRAAVRPVRRCTVRPPAAVACAGRRDLLGLRPDTTHKFFSPAQAVSVVSSRRSFGTGASAAAHQPQINIDALQVGRLNHIAIAVPELEPAARIYRDILGAHVSDPQPLPEHGVTVVFVALPNTKLELLEPLGTNSPIAGYLKKNPSGGMHHICVEVDDVVFAIKRLTESGMRVLDPEPKVGAHGKPVVFVHPKDVNGVLLELEQA